MLLEGKIIKQMYQDRSSGNIVIETLDHVVAVFGSDTVKGDSQMTCPTLTIDGKPVISRAVALEPAGA